MQTSCNELVECLKKAWLKPKAYQCQEFEQRTLGQNLQWHGNSPKKVVKTIVWVFTVKKLWKCLKTIFENVWKPYLKNYQLKRCDNQVKASLKGSKENSKFESS